MTCRGDRRQADDAENGDEPSALQTGINCILCSTLGDVIVLVGELLSRDPVTTNTVFHLKYCGPAGLRLHRFCGFQ